MGLARHGAAGAALIAVLAVVTPASAARPFVAAGRVGRAPSSAARRDPGPPGIRGRGYLVPNPAGYQRAKSRAAERASRASTAALGAGALASVQQSFPGSSDPSDAPPDTTDAIGPTRYIELVNTRFAIYDRIHPTPISTGSLASLVGAPHRDLLTDPQIIWDPDSRRFYYAEVDGVDAHHNFLAVGFSKTASPSGASSWCRYDLAFGRDFPDFPKLGDTANFLLVGVNAFRGRRFEGADVVWGAKPPSGRRCPPTLRGGRKRRLATAAGAPAFTPVPSNQIDSSGRGWIVATPQGAGLKSHLSLYSVHRTGKGSAAIERTGTNVRVSRYQFPPNAPQAGTNKVLDTADGRLTQAVSAIDPTRPAGQGTAIWTQHTVAGGGGSRVRWYEIDPASHSLFQEGVVSDPSLFDFNAAISPDRAVDNGVGAFGQNMVLTFDTSSASTLPAVDVVSKLGAAPQSAPLPVQSSSATVDDNRCAGFCRWGDYSGAAPDPAPPPGTSRVWASSQWQATRSLFGWRTVNLVVTP